ncbi:MAG: undecaprenyl-phosphate glucose phosphotransferase [Planctomycetota bacterium]
MMLGLLRAADAAATAAAWAAAYAALAWCDRLGWISGGRPTVRDLVPAAVLSMVLGLVIYSRLGLYEPKRTKRLALESWTVARAVAAAWAITYVLVGFMRPERMGRWTMALVGGGWLLFAVADRLGARLILRSFRSRGWNLRYAAIVGTGRLAQRLYHAVQRNRWAGIVVRYFVDGIEGRKKLFGIDVIGPVDQIDEFIAGAPVDIVFVALPGREHAKIEQVLNRLAMTAADVQVVPDLLSFHFLRHDVTLFDELPMIALTSSPQHGWNSVMKRAFDLVGAAVALVVFALPMAVFAVLIKVTSRGPVFYVQERTSLAGAPFWIVKFRTMVVDAEKTTGPAWATPDDPRVTRLGRWLRKTSLDELPQLLNVLSGHMSLVGPRPERPELIERFRKGVPRYMLRNQVKAGLTGWAQVHGLRGQTSLRKRIQYDLYYIANWSFGLDLRILLLTVVRGIAHPNAY